MKFSGQKLREIREAARLSQQELADKCVLKRQQINFWECNAVNPQADNLGKLANALECLMDELFEHTDEVV